MTGQSLPRASGSGFWATGVRGAKVAPGYGRFAGGRTDGRNFVQPTGIGRLYCLLRKPLRVDSYRWPVDDERVRGAGSAAHAALTSDYWGNGPLAPVTRRGYVLWAWWRLVQIMAWLEWAGRIVGLKGTAWRDRIRKYRAGLPPMCW